jgi:hypothetical protein
MIKPSIGRVVLVYRDGNTQWEEASICFVHSDELINVAGFDANGDPFKVTSIKLLQGDVAMDPIYPPGDAITGRIPAPFACWMPYQRKVAGSST